jgi:hypothetical protein
MIPTEAEFMTVMFPGRPARFRPYCGYVAEIRAEISA